MLFRSKHKLVTHLCGVPDKESFLTLNVGTLSKGSIFAPYMILYPERYWPDAAVLFITYHYCILITVLRVISQGSHISLLCSFFFLGSSFQSKFGLSLAFSLFTCRLLVCNSVIFIYFVLIKYVENKHGCTPTLWSVSEVHSNFPKIFVLYSEVSCFESRPMPEVSHVAQ